MLESVMHATREEKKKRNSFLSMIPASYNKDWPDKIYLLMQYEYYESNQTIFWVDLKPEAQDGTDAWNC